MQSQAGQPHPDSESPAQDDYVPSDSVAKCVNHVRHLSAELHHSSFVASIRQAFSATGVSPRSGACACTYALPVFVPLFRPLQMMQWRMYVCAFEPNRSCKTQLTETLSFAAFPMRSIRCIHCLGVGSPSVSATARAQLALLPTLQALSRGDVPILAFDPVFSATDVAILEQLGCKVLTEAEAGERSIQELALLYMPHCEAALYNEWLDDNWSPDALSKMAVIGNSFGAILVRASNVAKRQPA